MAQGIRRTKITEAQAEAAESEIEQFELSVKFLVTDYTVEFLVSKLRDGEYYVPSYQREFVWREPAQSRFIESVLIGLPIPYLFLWQDGDGRLEIVDGSQRLRTLQRFMDGELRLGKLELLEKLKGFTYGDLSRPRRRKFDARVIRGIVLDNSVGVTTRTEMFNRINTGGTKANEAEVRRGALPGPMSDLIQAVASEKKFEDLTPISDSLINQREREELAVRFFTFLERATIENGSVIFPEWKDRPREYIYEFVAQANAKGKNDPIYIDRLRFEFERMLSFVDANFPNGFRKSMSANQVPRVRFEAIAVGVGLALRHHPELSEARVAVTDWIKDKDFLDITTSDAANVRAKLQGRIDYVWKKLVA